MFDAAMLTWCGFCPCGTYCFMLSEAPGVRLICHCTICQAVTCQSISDVIPMPARKVSRQRAIIGMLIKAMMPPGPTHR
ncbi:hypothetical protein [Novosphingobium sp.]|uniref:hypothetical protein n=1 Tax=Novosphingobium sp. TaxID=1874826 RepID=UPI0031D28D38